MKLDTGWVENGISMLMLNGEVIVKLNLYVPTTVLPAIEAVISELLASPVYVLFIATDRNTVLPLLITFFGVKVTLMTPMALTNPFVIVFEQVAGPSVMVVV